MPCAWAPPCWPPKRTTIISNWLSFRLRPTTPRPIQRRPCAAISMRWPTGSRRCSHEPSVLSSAVYLLVMDRCRARGPQPAAQSPQSDLDPPSTQYTPITRCRAAEDLEPARVHAAVPGRARPRVPEMVGPACTEAAGPGRQRPGC